MSIKPKVSIIIPVYNGSNFLEQSIHSALSQTYSNIEVIVINDGSTDNGKTEEIALSFGDRIRYFSKPNGGVASALNRGISEMRGDYFSWLSHDDLYSINKIQNQMKHIAKLPQESISFCNFEFIDENGTVGESVAAHDYHEETFRSHLLENNFLHGCSLIIPKTVFEKAGTFNEQLKTTNDYELWFRIAQFNTFYHLNETLVQSRQHSQQTNRTMNAIHRKECNHLYIHQMNQLFDELKTNNLPNIYFARLAVKFYKNDFAEAASHAYYLYKKLLKLDQKKIIPPFYLTRLILKLYTIKKRIWNINLPFIAPTKDSKTTKL